MKKIIGILNPFDATQSFYFYEDGNRIDRLNCTIDKIPQSLVTFAKKYEITDVDVSGPSFFSQGIIKEIQKYMTTKYNQSILNIKMI